MAGYNLGVIQGAIRIAYNSAGVKQAQGDIGKLSDSGSALGKVGVVAAGAGVAIAGGLAVAINSAAEFQKKMSGVQAVSGASTDEMEKLRAKALQIGKDTSFSASEGADAIGELVKAGVSVPDVMNGAADATVALAAAGEVDLPRAATIASNALNQFKLQAKDLPHVADLLAGAANASAIDVTDLGESLNYVGPVANALGVSIDDASTAIALLGNNGIKGSSAGTALRSILSQLSPTSKVATKAMEELGLVTADGTNKFYDATGKVKPLDQVIGILHDSMAGLTKQQQVTFAKKAFGLESLAAVTALAGNTTASFDGMTASIGKIKAADVAKTRLDNLQGALQGFQGSVETVAINVGSLFLPALQGIVGGASDAVDAFGAAAPKIASLFSGIVALVSKGDGGGLGKLFNIDPGVLKGIVMVRDAVVGIVQKVVGFLKQLGSAVADLVATFGPLVAEIAGGFVLGLNAALNVLKPLGTAILAVTGFLREHSTIVRAVTVGLLAAAVAFGAWIVAVKIINMVKAAILAFRTAMFLLNVVISANPIGVIILALIALAAAIAYAWTHSETFRKIVIAVWNAIKNAFMAAINWIVNAAKTVWGKILDWIVNPIKKAWDWVTEKFSWVEAAVKAYFTTYIAIVKAVWGKIYDWVIQPIVNVVKGIVQNFTKIYNWISSAISTIVGFVKDHWQLLLAIFLGPLGLIIDAVVTHWDWIKNAFSTAINWIINFVKSVWNFISTYIIQPIQAAYDGVVAVVQAIVDWVVGKFNEFMLGLQIIWDTISGAVVAAWNAIYAFFSNIVTTIVNWVVAYWNTLVTGLQAIWNAISAAVSAAWNAVYGVISSIVTTIVNWVTGKITAIKNTVVGVWNSISSVASTAWNTVYTAVKTAIDNIVTTVTGIGTTIKNAFSTAITWLADAGKNLVTGLWNGISGAAGWLWNQIKGFVSSVKDNVLGFFGIHSPSRMFMWIGKMLTLGLAAGVTDNSARAVAATVGMMSDVQNAVNKNAISTSAAWSTPTAIGALRNIAQQDGTTGTSTLGASSVQASILSRLPGVAAGNGLPKSAAPAQPAAGRSLSVTVTNPPQPTTEDMVVAAINNSEALYGS